MLLKREYFLSSLAKKKKQLQEKRFVGKDLEQKIHGRKFEEVKIERYARRLHIQ